MCGITGIYAFNEAGNFFTEKLQNSIDTLKKRGPDSEGSFKDHYIALGHCRLSIIDLSTQANQPMKDAKGRYIIVFNGEIYNFKEIKKDLQKKGINFETNCDTEVLLQLYIIEKEKCLQKLNGFFSFAIYDTQERSLFIARDRMGIKPLCYYLDKDKLIFASEIQALLAYGIPKEMDYVSLYQYFQLSYIPAPHSIFQNVYKLLPGYYMQVKDKKINIKRFYEVNSNSQYKNISYQNAQKKLLSLLEDSVSLRMISDVALGAFLSGGIDSSVIVAIAAKLTPHLNTFSIGYKDESLFDETHYADQVAKKYQTNHTVFQLDNDDFYKHTFNLLDYMGEPFADSSVIPTYILSQYTRKNVTVALSGDGADEIFAGYNKYMGEFRAREKGILARIVTLGLPLWKRLPKTRNTFIGNKTRQLYRFAQSMNQEAAARYWYLSSWRSESEAYNIFHLETSNKIIQKEYNTRKQTLTQYINGENFNEVLLSDVYMLLPNDMLYKVDAMSMANSLEVRTPFLDHRIVNFAFSLPDHYKIDVKMKKKILQDAARYLLPKSLYKRPKHGFDVPLEKGYKTTLRSWVESCLDEDLIKTQGIFNNEFIKKLRYTIFNTRNFDQNQVWAILAFQHWWKNTY